MIRIAIVGLGSIGKRHARLLLERKDVRVEVVESQPQALAAARQELGNLSHHESFDAMLQSRPDAVLLATPTPLHARQSIAALEAGLAVLCEKPMTDSVADAQAVRQAVERTGMPFSVAFHLHFHPMLRKLRQMIADGELGQVMHLHAHIGTYITLVNSRSRYQATQVGSLFFDYAHEPDLFYWLLGRAPTRVNVLGMQAGNLELSSRPNLALVNLSYDQPTVASIHLNYVQSPERKDYEIIGDRGWVRVDFTNTRLEIGKAGQSAIQSESFQVERDQLYRDEHAAFLELMAGRKPPETSAAAGVVSVAVCQAARESFLSSAPVTVTL